MLGKVMKYELRACGRLLLPGFGAALALVLLLRALMALAGLLWKPAVDLTSGLAAGLGTLAITAIFLLTTAYLVVRFYQGMAGGEATLTFTLPVKASTQLFGRFAVAMLYSLLGLVAVVVCAVTLIPGAGRFLLGAESILVQSTPEGPLTLRITDLPAGLLLSLAGLGLVFTLLAIATSLLQYYAGVALGTLFGTNRIAGSVIGYLIVNMVQGFGMVLLMLIPAVRLIGTDTSQVLAFMEGLLRGTPLDAISALLGFMWAMVGLMAAVMLPFALAEYLLTQHIFSKRLNVI